MHWFLVARCSGEPVSRFTTGDLSPFRFSPKVSGTEDFSGDISPANLRSTAQVRNPQGISKLVNKVYCQVPRALLKAIARAFLATKSFAAGSSMCPWHMACVSKPVPRDIISSSDCQPPQLRIAVDVMRDSQR